MSLLSSACSQRIGAVVALWVASTLHAATGVAEPPSAAAVAYRDGLTSYTNQRFADAAQHFERAYALDPNWHVLFDLGHVYTALGRPVDAVNRYERYLQAGGAEIPAERRAAVEAELVQQRSTLGKLDLVVHTRGANVLVDMKPVGRGPLATELPVAEGVHLVVAEAADYETFRKEVTIPARQTVRIEPTLTRRADAVAVMPAAIAPPRVELSHAGRAQRVAAYVVGGAGLAAAATGGWMALDGDKKHRDAVKTWEAGDRELAREMEDDATRGKRIGFAVLGAGGVAFATGVVLLLAAPRATRLEVARITPWANGSAAGLSVRGALH